MAYALTWIPAALRGAGLTVVEQPGWQTRGHGDVGKTLGVLCHHTAGALKGNAPSLKIVQNGRPDLRGPLAQLVLGRDGTFYMVAAGLCYHAGAGNWRGCRTGNRSLIGIEAENTGLANDNPWPAVQLDAYVRGVAALLKHIGASADMAVGHLEYALPVGRKSDPSFSVGNRQQRIKAMDDFRARVAAAMRGAPAAEVGDVDDGPGDDDADDDAAKDDAPKSLLKSKIAQAGAGVGLLGGTEVIGQANEAAEKVKTLKQNAADIGVFDWLQHLVTSPRFLIGVAIMVLAGAAIYWRWRDHGKGAEAS